MRTPTALQVVVALALVSTGIAGVATAATVGEDASTAEDAATATSTASDVDIATAADTAWGVDDASLDDNLTVRVNTPRAIAKNVTQNYSVDVSGANGTVTATWTFGDETKQGSTVQHTWVDSGNATITVTVTDESGASVTRELAIEIVAYGSEDDDDDGNPLRALGTIGLIIFAMVGIIAMNAVLIPKVMERITDDFW
jgi:hypothetical protein